MKGLFVESSIFSKIRADYLSDDEYRQLQTELLVTPTKGDVIQGTGGLRKIRSASKDSEKRGGVVSSIITLMPLTASTCLPFMQKMK